MKDTSTFQKTFTICQYHLDFLEGINQNTSATLRDLLDKAINTDNKHNSREIRDKSVIFISFSMVVFLLGYSIPELYVKVGAFVIGGFLLCYGSIGGLLNVLRLSK